MHLQNPPQAPLCRSATCDASIAVGDCVSVRAAAAGALWDVDLTDPSSSPFRPAVGIVKSKTNTTTCVVQTSGVLLVVTGLAPGAQYYVGVDGKVARTTDPNFPEPVDGVRLVRQLIGIATSSDQLLVLPSTPIVPRYHWQSLNGTIDGANLVFTTDLKFVSGNPNRETVKRNGLEQCEGSGGDYAASESTPGSGFDTITFADPPKAGDVLSIDFQPLL